MRKNALYSSSRRDLTGRPFTGRPALGHGGRADASVKAGPAPQGEAASAESAQTATAKPATGLRARWRQFAARREKSLLVISTAATALLAVAIYLTLIPHARQYTQHDIDLAVRSTLEKLPPGPSAASKAYAVIRPSVVRVNQLEKEKDSDEVTVKGVGTGVIIDENGTILTNLHVVAGADKVGVEFVDGSKSEAEVISVQPENDLAVLKPAVIPDDIVPATLKSTAKLRPGDEVIAVGNPFGIGISASDGIISGLRRNYVSTEGKNVLSNLIQFDAAANPGNSGGPLVTTDGEVIGIVTAILNPTSQRVFIGIGFAVPIENAAAAAGENPF